MEPDEEEEFEGETHDDPPENPAPQTIRIKGKRTFRKYIDKSGLKFAFVRALVGLYEEEEKPDEALAYVCQHMGIGIPTVDDVASLQEKVNALRLQMEALETENEAITTLIESAQVGEQVEDDGIDPELRSLLDSFVLPRGSYFGLIPDEEEMHGEWDLEEEQQVFEVEGKKENSSDESDAPIPKTYRITENKPKQPSKVKLNV